ncbi:Phospholipid scramblase 1 [Holothuria leucospilota]|uniref:Phospholipid scramblase n=1 Tax=Holothuria leucospilota TaxID=206669 RepID=A0A9Q1CNB0_HOLLE|nr:Phospholipid scramblase 1 [Holothuria leucospilota]
MEAKPDNEPTQDTMGINTPTVLPAPVLPAPVLSANSASVLPAPVLPAPVLPAPVLPAPVLPAPVLSPPVLPAPVLSPPVLSPGQTPPGQAPQIIWMPQPSTITGCPPGLEYLTQLDQILVHQQVELLETFTPLETENRYHIKNSLGQQVFFAQEESDPLLRQHLRSRRNFTMHVVDNVNQEVMRVVRPSQHCTGLSTVAVEAPPGQPIGHVSARIQVTLLLQYSSFIWLTYRFHLWDSYLEVFDASLQPVLKIRGSCCYCEGPGDIDFRVMTPDESQQVGKISKQWSGHIQEYYTTADNFGINFPMDLDVKVKATLLGALFLMDFMLFEHRPIHNNQVGR